MLPEAAGVRFLIMEKRRAFVGYYFEAREAAQWGQVSTKSH